jgi:hypothetical protein
LKFDGPYDDHLYEINRSIMIAIDATDFSSKMTSDVQYMREPTYREIIKAIVGFQGV